jgi:fermentation-respiration switch protein FrsA (DUF1100 family)
MLRASASQPSRQPPPLWWRVVRVPLIAYLLIMLMMMWLENSLIYFPTKYSPDTWNDGGSEFEDAEFTSADGTRLHGWYVAAENPQAEILFCHGNAGNVTHRADLLWKVPRQAQASLLVFDYRGFGKSEGTPNETGVLADARAARAWLAKRAGVAESEIVLMGESLGAAVAVDLAAEDGARGLVLENAFTSLPDVAAYHYPWLPVRWLMRGQLNSLAKIGRYHGPLLMSHGDADSIVPYPFGQRLFAAANEPKRFITRHAGDHNDAREESFYDALQEFVEALNHPQARRKS